MMYLSYKNRTAFAILILATASFVLYCNTLQNGFVWDDIGVIKSNVWIRNVKFIPEILTQNAWGFMNMESSYYRPVIHLAYMLVYHIFGPGPWGFHLLNIIFNAISTVLVFLLAMEIVELSGATDSRVFGIAFLSALLFAADPIHTEAVAFAAAFTELSYTLFYLVSLYFFVLWRKGKLKEGIYLSCLFFVLSFLSKETALTLPLAIAAFDIAFPGVARLHETRGKLHRVKVYLPYFVLSAVYFAIRLKVIGRVANSTLGLHLTAFQLFLNAIVNFGMYLGQLVYPFNLNAYHVFHPVHSVFEWRSIFSLAALLLFTALIFLSYKKNRLVFFGLLIIIIPLLPAFYLPVFQPGSTYAERYLYLSSAGFSLSAAYFICTVDGAKTRVAALAFAALILIAYSKATVYRNAVWKDEASLWTDTVNKSPNGWVPHYQLGIVLKSKGEYVLAANHFSDAMKLAPNAPGPVINLGYALIAMGKVDEAEKRFKEAIRMMPLYSDAHLGLGAAYAMKGDDLDAKQEFIVGIGLNPTAWQGHCALGLLYYQEDQFIQALQEFSRALYIDPYSGGLHRNIGLVYVGQGSLDKAIVQFKTAIRLNPADPENFICLGNAYQKKGLRNQAEESYQAALKIDPKNSEAQEGLKALAATTPRY